jgi:hypothetical protein
MSCTIALDGSMNLGILHSPPQRLLPFRATNAYHAADVGLSRFVRIVTSHAAYRP